jgi:hypothetical protein
MPILLAVFPSGKLLGPSGFAEPLAVSTQQMVVDRGTKQVISICPLSNHLMEFEIASETWHDATIQSDGFELVVFLTDRSDDNGDVIAFPIGCGSFVVDNQVQETDLAIEFKIHPISPVDDYPPVKVLKTQATTDTPQKVVFATTTINRASLYIVATYQFDKQVGGNARILVDLGQNSCGDTSVTTTESPRQGDQDRYNRASDCYDDEEEENEGYLHEEFLHRRVYFHTKKELVANESQEGNYDHLFIDDEDPAKALARAKIAATLTTPPRRGSTRDSTPNKNKIQLRSPRKNQKISNHRDRKKDSFPAFLRSAVESKADLPITTMPQTPDQVPSFNEDSFMNQLENTESIPSLPMITHQSTFETFQTESWQQDGLRKVGSFASVAPNRFLCTMNSLFSCGQDPNQSIDGVDHQADLSFMESWDTIEELFVVFSGKGH